jgi:hypothetical protein
VLLARVLQFRLFLRTQARRHAARLGRLCVLVRVVVRVVVLVLVVVHVHVLGCVGQQRDAAHRDLQRHHQRRKHHHVANHCDVDRFRSIACRAFHSLESKRRTLLLWSKLSLVFFLFFLRLMHILSAVPARPFSEETKQALASEI